jgi:hypothetical protein
LEQIGTDLVMDDTRLFYRHQHVWHNNKHEVKHLLLNRIQSYDILDYRYRLQRQPPRRTRSESHAVAAAGAASQPVTVPGRRP